MLFDMKIIIFYANLKKHYQNFRKKLYALKISFISEIEVIAAFLSHNDKELSVLCLYVFFLLFSREGKYKKSKTSHPT